ncbi:MAG: RNA polymerase sigma factor [Patescibacteria group bacterium]|nr:RNA polymerase sigma factor [Patescibacteria group bacterium]
MSSRFTARYEADADSVFRFCFLRVSDRELALDITQETFGRFWRSLSGGEDIANERAFLFTVAHRLVIDWYRRKKAARLEDLTGADGEPYDPPDEKTLDSLGLEAEGRFLADAISKIDGSNRHAVYLRFIEGLSPPEIGEVLGISTGAASVRVSRGLAELKKITGYDDIDEHE